MTDEEIIRELKNVEKEYENKPTPTFSINISSMTRSCRQHIEQLAEENEKLKGYKNIVDTIKAEGFETFCEVKMFLQEHKKLEEENEELKMKLLTLENKEQIVATTISN